LDQSHSLSLDPNTARSTACEAWALLDKWLSPLSKVHLRTLHDQIRTLKKDLEKSVGDFLLHAKSLVDSLTAAGSPISDTELIEFIIDGLGHEYKEFITSLYLCPTDLKEIKHNPQISSSTYTQASKVPHW
jgi:lipoate-protein ligase A